MSKLLSTITIIAILGILVAVGFFGYTKYQEVELRKDKLQAQQKENNDNDSNAQASTDTENESPSQDNPTSQETPQQQESNDGSEWVKVHKGGTTRIANKQEFSNLKVNRDNVFDYLIAGINQSEGGDASLITFQQPEFILQNGGMWKIAANNKSGAGSYTFTVKQDGTVEFWDGFMDDKFEEQKVTLP
ncbi:hypothetical protein [Staphylococcus caledonicus]|uniref:hypothetical protein n=1 Tax=Staphylococcus caledonicus TaxID=2741333 RepID=UPI001E2AAD42|nr:hypothetical protein [Staphylococcus caledonicus]